MVKADLDPSFINIKQYYYKIIKMDDFTLKRYIPIFT